MVSIQDLLLPTEEEPVASPRGFDGRPGGKSAASPTKGPGIAGSTHFRVEFILDTICPHCYIGLKNLSAAIQIHQERHPEDTFEVTFSPIILNRAAGRSAYDKGTYYISHRGWTPSHLANWANMGAAAGIAFSWRGLTGHSRDSHKLLRFALEDRPTTVRSTTFARGVGTTATALTGASAGTGTRRGMGTRAADPTPHSDRFPSISTPNPFAPPPQTPRLHQRPPSAGASTGYHDPTRPDSHPPVSPQPQARGPALQFRLAHAVFRAYFEEDRDLSDRASLAEIGAAVVGYPVAEVRACLDDDEDHDGGGDGYGGDGVRSRVGGEERRYSRDDPQGKSIGKGKRRDDQIGGIREGQRDRFRGSEGPDDNNRRLRLGQAGSSGGESKGEGEDDRGGSGGGWGRAVDALEADVRARGIAAVPTIIVQERYLAGGWQEAQLFVELFESIRSAEEDLQQQQRQRSRSDIED